MSVWGYGLYADVSGGTGGHATCSGNVGVYGNSDNAAGVYGNSTDGSGVTEVSSAGNGGWFASTNGGAQPHLDPADGPVSNPRAGDLFVTPVSEGGLRFQFYDGGNWYNLDMTLAT
jgi:hypothetical protein